MDADIRVKKLATSWQKKKDTNQKLTEKYTDKNRYKQKKT